MKPARLYNPFLLKYFESVLSIKNIFRMYDHFTLRKLINITLLELAPGIELSLLRLTKDYYGSGSGLILSMML